MPLIKQKRDINDNRGKIIKQCLRYDFLKKKSLLELVIGVTDITIAINAKSL